MEVHPSVAAHLIGPGGANLRELEKELGRTIYVRGNSEVHLESMSLKVLGTRAEVEARALPVKPGDRARVRIDEAHASNPSDGIARVEGYVIDVADAGQLVGKQVDIEVIRAFRTYAKARLVDSDEAHKGGACE